MSRGTLAGDASKVLAGRVGIAGHLVAAGTERYRVAGANTSGWVNMMIVLDLRV